MLPFPEWGTWQYVQGALSGPEIGDPLPGERLCDPRTSVVY
jgi:hypothetical protein